MVSTQDAPFTPNFTHFQTTYGRNRESIADIEATLFEIFEKRTDSTLNPEGERVVPASALTEVLDAFAHKYNGQRLLGDAEVAAFQEFLSNNPDLQMTPAMVVALVAQMQVAPPAQTSPPASPGYDDGSGSSDEIEEYLHSHSRSVSTDSTVYSRPPSRGPTTPGMKSPLDSDRRQRSTPLQRDSAPSSWPHKRPAPAGRRKSDAGNRSDSESNAPPVSFGRIPINRARTPSNPSSPSNPTRDVPDSPSNYRRPSSRPHSRTRSNPTTPFDLGYASPDDTMMPRYGMNYDSFDNAVSSLPMPRGSGSDSDEEDIDAGLGLVMDRSKTVSTASMEITERLEALQRTNEDLSRKCIEAEQTLQRKIEEHELELDETHHRLEELRTELAASNREEKELRSKDTRNMGQIAALEAEVAKIQKALDGAKATYSSLQRQYQEQCAFAEKYRDDLRRRDETIRTLREAVSLHELETAKGCKERESYEERIAALELEVSNAMEAYTQLDEQKQENLLLKETIDRMRFDMDEMRNAMVPGASSGQSSATNTMSRTLGAELGQVNWDPNSSSETEVEEANSDGSLVISEEDTEVEEDEDVIQTIITKRKRKVASRAIVESTRRTFEEMKEYSDGACQYDPTLFSVNHGMQTEPEPKIIRATLSIQTDEIPQPKPLPAPLPRITVEMEIQTETEEVEPSRSPSPAHDESLASSSSTIVPPTPKPIIKQLEHLDEPPAYHQITITETDEWRLATDTLKKWHGGVKMPFQPIPGGVTPEMVEEWKALKQELGVECMVIDKIIDASEHSEGSSGSSSAVARGTPKEVGKPTRRGRFYNIYNTYVYGDKSSQMSGVLSQAVMFAGASALVILAVTPYVTPQAAIPGGATYYDRAAWNSFNSMHGGVGEGFGMAPDGTAAVWNFLGRVGGGAARLARGWPT
ncbi:hypothetical protein BDN70DRAFT_937155 [Pholiota conissans]|uniref:Uncharacterized protein n=1 Tax=Pholiota conissans TaxID=109636 RepID=A0A9P5YTT8_9AGAR|nr:hypothetical protein BDN70DRAFT_937155 [Pholiota conissans]